MQGKEGGQMTLPIKEQELLRFLLLVQTGEIALEPETDPIPYAGDVKYKASNGWTIVVFNDCGDWDYIDLVETDDGRRTCFEDISKMAVAHQYRPNKKVSLERYKI